MLLENEEAYWRNTTTIKNGEVVAILIYVHADGPYGYLSPI